MMARIQPGQRLLLALTDHSEQTEETSETLHVSGIILAVGGLLSLVFLVLMCVCKKSSPKHGTEDLTSEDVKKPEKKSTIQSGPDVGDLRPKVAADAAIAVNGGPAPVQATSSSTVPGHSRQASAGSAHAMRPTSLRELPQPPVSTQHSRSISLSGPDVPGSSGKGGGGGDYTYPQHFSHPRIAANSSTEQIKSHSDGYDHLGPKPSVRPTDYDRLADTDSTDGETPISETGGVLDSHYAQVKERTYAVVKDVRTKAKGLFDPYTAVKDKDDAGSDYYSQVKEEDPYNHIGDSDGAVSSSFIRHLKSVDMDDPYATVQEDSGAENARETLGAVGGAVGGTKQHALPSPSNSMTPKYTHSPAEYPDAGDEYAVVQKARGQADRASERERETDINMEDSTFNYRPPEPPRLYDNEDEFVSPTPKHKKEHKYSKVTARESLASMSARNALNPYEIVPDVPENTYATVEGGSGDGVVMRGASATSQTQEENRLSQNSETYAEIGISGGGLSSSVISNSSSTGGNNNNNSSSSSVAPTPPSLDSLHLMTKSQTSSEGDRLSDRHLASPEDSGLGLNQWTNPQEDEDSGESTEDGYSTLKKAEYSSSNLSQQHNARTSRVTDQESGEVTLVPNYQTVKDCISDSEILDEPENDPNYESVDETRAKVAALKARTSSWLEEGEHGATNWKGGNGNHVTVVKVLHLNSSGSSLGGEGAAGSEEPRRRRLFHDYEEVDISPPASPSTPTSSNHPMPLSSPGHRSFCTNITSTTDTTTTVSSQHTQLSTSMMLSEAREQVIQSHMYEELTEVRAKTSEITKSKKQTTVDKNHVDVKKKSSSNDHKKSEDKRSSSDHKKSEDKRKSGGEGKKKSPSDDKKKNSLEEKKKEGGSNIVSSKRL